MVSCESVEVTISEPVQKRPRLLDEAVKEVGATGDVSLKFSDSFATENQSLVLLQVPESLLSEIGEDASRDMVRLIGSEDQDAVLVTEGKTFKLTKAETSNTLLLMPPEGTAVTSVPATACGKGGGEAGGGGFEAVAAVGFQYEVSQTTPSLEQVREVLETCLYRGKEEESTSVDREQLEMCSFSELQDRVQFSRRELLEGLKRLEAVLIEGRWRLIEPALMERTADALLSIIVEQDMPLDKVETEVCLAALPDCEPLVLEHCLKTYSVDQDDTARVASTTGAAATEALDKGVYKLDLDKVAQLRAHQILRTHESEDHDRRLFLPEFMELWATSMPGVETPQKELLKGIALLERKGGGDDKTATVSYVPASGLPFAPAERLAELFRIKPKWPMGELEPYISEADRKAGFLLKHARFSTDPATGQKLFSAR